MPVLASAGWPAFSAASRRRYSSSMAAVEVAHAAGGFDLDFRRDAGPHEREVVLGRAPVVVVAVGLLDEAVTGRGLHPVGPGALAKPAELLLEFIAAQAGAAFGQIIVLEDDFHLRAVLVGFVADGLNIALDVVPIAA